MPRADSGGGSLNRTGALFRYEEQPGPKKLAKAVRTNPSIRTIKGTNIMWLKNEERPSPS